jgi:hypothetical protein
MVNEVYCDLIVEVWAEYWVNSDGEFIAQKFYIATGISIHVRSI